MVRANNIFTVFFKLLKYKKVYIKYWKLIKKLIIKNMINIFSSITLIFFYYSNNLIITIRKMQIIYVNVSV
jgi:hypothetical protein